MQSILQSLAKLRLIELRTHLVLFVDGFGKDRDAVAASGRRGRSSVARWRKSGVGRSRGGRDSAVAGFAVQIATDDAAVDAGNQADEARYSQPVLQIALAVYQRSVKGAML